MHTKKTQNYDLPLAEYNDTYNWFDINQGFETIDTQLKMTDNQAVANKLAIANNNESIRVLNNAVTELRSGATGSATDIANINESIVQIRQHDNDQDASISNLETATSKNTQDITTTNTNLTTEVTRLDNKIDEITGGDLQAEINEINKKITKYTKTVPFDKTFGDTSIGHPTSRGLYYYYDWQNNFKLKGMLTYDGTISIGTHRQFRLPYSGSPYTFMSSGTGVLEYSGNYVPFVYTHFPFNIIISFGELTLTSVGTNVKIHFN